MAETSNFELFRGTSPKLRFKLVVPESVLGWTTMFYMRPTYGANTTLAIPGTIVDVDNGVFDVPLSTANTNALSIRSYVWSFERTNSGAEDVLALGSSTVKNR